MSSVQSGKRSLRLLVAIASYGSKNIELLRRILAAYRAMPFDVDIVVLSNEAKDLGPGIEVAVGLPSSNPWSLPFAHKPIFAERVDDYDLFIYSEDDMAATVENIDAFVRATPHLGADEIAGFLRYEVDKTGARSMPDAHGVFHWIPESVRRREGGYTVAEFSNEHAAFYILDRSQLKKAIASGGFVREPYEGRHDMLCAAATDPYTSCGFRKVICVSDLDGFLIHHASNRYAGEMGLSLGDFERQIATLDSIADGRHPASTLCRSDTGLSRGWWSKSYYEDSAQPVIDQVPASARTILSIGCGWGATEAALMRRGAHVAALPLDSVIGAEAARRGIEIVYGTLDEALLAVEGRKFDCVVMTNLLHMLDDPGQAVRRFARLLAPGGTFVASGPNFGSMRMLAKRALGRSAVRSYSRQDQTGVHTVGPTRLSSYLRHAGLSISRVRWLKGGDGAKAGFGRLQAEDWILEARSARKDRHRGQPSPASGAKPGGPADIGLGRELADGRGAQAPRLQTVEYQG